MQKTVTGFLLKYLNNLLPLSTEILAKLILENIFKLRKQASMQKKLGTPSHLHPRKSDVTTSSCEQGATPHHKNPNHLIAGLCQPEQKLPLPYTKNHFSHSPTRLP